MAVASVVDGWGPLHEYRDAPTMPARMEQLLSTMAKELSLEKRKPDHAVMAVMAQVHQVLAYPDLEPKVWDPIDTSLDDEEDM